MTLARAMTWPLDEPNVVSFFVNGDPVTQGNHKTNRAGFAYETTKGHRAWRDVVSWSARLAWRERAPLDCAVALELTFYVKPPKGARVGDLPHRSGGDNSKLTRAVEDALEDAGVFTNDRRITDSVVRRRYAFGEQSVGCHVAVGPCRG